MVAGLGVISRDSSFTSLVVELGRLERLTLRLLYPSAAFSHSLSSMRALGWLDVLHGNSGLQACLNWEAPGRNFIIFYALTFEVAECHFRFILFMGRRIRLYLLMGIRSKNLQRCFKIQNGPYIHLSEFFRS